MRELLVLAVAVAGLQPALRPQTATDIHLVSMAGGPASLATARPRPMATEPGYENQPFFDPEGRHVLYTANRDGAQTDIFDFDRTSGTTRQLTRTPEGEYSPTIPAAQPAAAALARRGFTVIRVESDGTQRLWQFDREGRDPRLVLEDIKPVGYHAWIDAGSLALYVLGQPPTLQIARVGAGKAEIVATDIGRTLRVVPGSSRVSFVQREAAGTYAITSLDPATGARQVIVRTVEGSLDRDYEWMPDGETLLMSAGTKVFAWSRRTPSWREVLDVAPHGLGEVSRLAVSPAGDALALVTAEPNPR